ncbi:melatonin receptor type 1B-B-like [Lineus longissimus]|uniref:melatonin receptor type 1B-B-like n=1 Tax=Lineus longissimus TaxID=88925 RepID=UPI00315E0110
MEEMINGESDDQYKLTEFINHQTWISDAVFIGVLMCVGIIGNLLILGAVIVTKKLRNTTNVFVCNVAVSDLFVAGYVLPTIFGNIIKQGSILSIPVCVFTACVLLTSCGVSLISFAMIAFNRYISICHHGRYARIFPTRSVVIMVVLVWVFSLTTVVVGLIPGVCIHFYHHAQIVCTFNNRLSAIYTFCLICIGIVAPSCLTGSFYFAIYTKIKTTGQKVRSHTSGALSSAMVARQQKENRAILCMFLAYLIFVVLWFPFGMVVLIDIYYPVHPLLFRIVGWLAFSNSCVDWIVYGAMNNHFKDAYKNILTCFRRKRKVATSSADVESNSRLTRGRSHQVIAVVGTATMTSTVPN